MTYYATKGMAIAIGLYYAIGMISIVHGEGTGDDAFIVKAIPINQNVRLNDGRGNSKIFYTSLDNAGMRYFEAMGFCFKNGMSPAVITSAAEDEVLRSYLEFLAAHYNTSGINTRPFWLSLNDIEVEGNFTWAVNKYGESTKYFNWAPGSPTTGSGGCNLDCVSAQQINFAGNPKKFGWINVPCSTKWRPLCESFGPHYHRRTLEDEE